MKCGRKEILKIDQEEKQRPDYVPSNYGSSPFLGMPSVETDYINTENIYISRSEDSTMNFDWEDFDRYVNEYRRRENPLI